MRLRLIEVLLFLSLTGNLMFAYLIHQERSRGKDTTSHLDVGTAVGSITGSDDSGRSIAISEDPKGRPTVLYAFSPTCVWCEKTNPALRVLIQKEKERFRFVAADLSLPVSPAEPYIRLNALEFESVIHPNAQTRQQLGLNGTPDTLVIDTKGKIIRAFHGAYVDSILQSVNEFFGLNLAQSEMETAPVQVRGKNCLQDGLSFSIGSRICWKGKTYFCSPDSTWGEDKSTCDKELYLAQKHPGQ